MTLIGNCKNRVIGAPFHNASVDVMGKVKPLPQKEKERPVSGPLLMLELKVSSQTLAIGP